MHLILAMAALKDWVAYGIDVQNTYLYGDLDEEIYMKQPEGFNALGKPKEKFVLLLLKALYRLEQSGLAWWKAVKQSMEELGLVSLVSDAGVFIYKDKGTGSFVIVVIYVDDTIFVTGVCADLLLFG